MKIFGAMIVCAVALYAVDALYCDGEYCFALHQWLIAVARGS
jgi:hypothetical protein